MICKAFRHAQQVSGNIPEKHPGNAGEFPIINEIKHLTRLGE